MQLNRRTFLGAVTGAAVTQSSSVATSQILLAPARSRAHEPLDILILGGTGFLGPAMVAAAKARGHKITLFNRGRTNAHLFPELDKIRGDRNKPDDIAKIGGHAWDVVFDNCGYFPHQVEASVGAVKDSAAHYVFVSTLSVFRGDGGVVHDEQTATASITDEECAAATEDHRIDGYTYGPLKVRCENAVEAIMPGKATNVRPGLIVGPGDPTQRFTYWPARIASGGEVLAPGNPNGTTQFIDVRDIAIWLVHAAEQRHLGTYHAVGFDGTVTLQEVLHGCKVVLGTHDTKFTWVDEEFLQAEGVRPFMGPNSLPLWIPGGRPEFSNRKAIRDGMTFRPIGDTIRDTYAWWKEQPEKPWQRAGMAAEAEQLVLGKWHEREPSTIDASAGNAKDDR